VNIGIGELKRQLEEIGIKTELIASGGSQFVSFHYKIPHGRFRDKEIEIALEAPQFPLNPPSGPYIKPHIMAITGGGGVHPTGGIHQNNKPTSEWQYWSRPFHNWNNSAKDAKTYLAFIRTLLDFE
jgi:hypothetical protein